MIAALLGVAVAVSVPRLHHPSRTVEPGPRSTSDSAPGPVPSSAQRVLDRMARAVLTHDRSAYLAQLAPGSARAQLLRRFDHGRRVPFRVYRYTATSSAADRGGVMTLRVDLAYRITDGTALTHRSWRADLARSGAHPWRVRSLTRATRTPPDPWDLGPVAVAVNDRAVVLGTGDPAGLQAYARRARTAALRIDAGWGTRWPRRTLVVVPANQGQLARMLGSGPRPGLDQVAAVTTGDSAPGSGSTAGRAARVIVNPGAMASLSDLGRQVTLTHEMTHVATRATSTATVPLWLAEGFADQVAYTGSGLTDRRIASGALSRATAARLTGLPADSRFDPNATKVDSAYVQAWAAADEIARRYGRARLVAFYRAVASPARPGKPAAVRVADAFTRVLGVREADFVPRWRARVERIAG